LFFPRIGEVGRKQALLPVTAREKNAALIQGSGEKRPADDDCDVQVLALKLTSNFQIQRIAWDTSRGAPARRSARDPMDAHPRALPGLRLLTPKHIKVSVTQISRV